MANGWKKKQKNVTTEAKKKKKREKMRGELEKCYPHGEKDEVKELYPRFTESLGVTDQSNHDRVQLKKSMQRVDVKDREERCSDTKPPSSVMMGTLYLALLWFSNV